MPQTSDMISSIPFIGGAIGGITSLFEKEPGGAANDPNFFQIASDQAIARDNQLHDRMRDAGGLTMPDKEGGSSSLSGTIPPITGDPSLAERTAAIHQKTAYNVAKSNYQASLPQSSMSQLWQGVKQFAGNTAQNIGTSLANTGMQRLLRPQRTRVPNFPRSAAQGVVSGHQQKAYMDAAYPGTNPWERLGGSTGASMGGQGAAQIQATSAENVAGISSRAHVDAAHISSLPNLKRVELEYQHLPHKVQETQANINEKIAGAHGKYTTMDLQEQQRLESQARTTLIPQLGQAKIQLENAKTEESAQKAKQIIQQTINELANLPAVKENALIQRNLRRVSDVLSGEDWRVYTTLGVAVLGKLITSLPGMLSVFRKGKSSYKPITSSKGWSSFKKANPWNP